MPYFNHEYRYLSCKMVCIDLQSLLSIIYILFLSYQISDLLIITVTCSFLDTPYFTIFFFFAQTIKYWVYVDVHAM